MNIISYGEQKKKAEWTNDDGWIQIERIFYEEINWHIQFQVFMFTLSNVDWIKKKNEQNGIAHFGSNNTSNR